MPAELPLFQGIRSWGVTELPLICRSESDQKAVREQLDRILKSGPFLQARRRQRFLEYIVNETLAGRGERLKGYDVAREVFDRSEAFDPNVDPIVRVEAARVRDKLREYYEADGRSDPIRIDLPKGTYTPHIEFRQAPTLEPQSEQSNAKTPEQPLDPVDVRATLTDERSSPTRPWPKLRMQWQMAMPALALILVLGAVGAWHYRNPSVPAPERTAEDAVVDVPKGPAIAVLPFVNLSGDPKQEYFSDGLTEDILTELSRTRDLRVLARNTTFQFKGKSVDVSKLGRDLKVRYVLEGSIQHTGDRLRATAQLIDAETGTHIWADRYDREMADIFLVQDEIVSQIVSNIAGVYGVIDKNEAKSSARKSPQEIEAYELVLHAHDVMIAEWSRETFRSAKEMLLQAIALDPLNARARRELAWLAAIGWVFRFDETPMAPQEITAEAIKAVQLDPTDARARMVAACVYFWTKQLDQFEHEAQKAMALAPYDAEIMVTLGFLIASSGQWERGLALAKKANALNADAANGWYQSTMHYDYYLKGDYEHALEFRRLHSDQKVIYAYIEYIPIYGQLGRKREALENWRKLLNEDRGWTAESFENWYRMWNMRDQDIAKLMDGVYKSGVLGVDAKPGQ
jgi:adenylate cyclase